MATVESARHLSSYLYCWLVATGEQVISTGLAHEVDRTDRRDLSIFRIGRDCIERCLALEAPIPIAFAPNFCSVPGSWIYQPIRISGYNFSMSAPLIATKLVIPPPHAGTVPRPQLMEKLDVGLRAGLLLVSAPAGFGKTTLIANWLRHLPEDDLVAWLSLDDGDNDPVRFWSYFIAALQTLWPGIGKDVRSMLATTRPIPMESVLTILINEIAALDADAHGLLVLDDLQLVVTEPILRGLTFLVEHKPSQLILVIGTRSDPPLPLTRLRARQRLVEVRLDDLRFSTQEIAALLQGQKGLSVSEKEIAALESHTEGWIAGLQMAALSIHSASDPADFIRALTSSNRYVLDYLLEEVLQRESQDVHDFLLQTSLLSRFCVPLCNAVTQRSDGQALLDHIEKSNLFLIPLDYEHRWYRYHPLFAELLTRQLERTSPNLIPSLHHRAADWLEENEDFAGAIRHILYAQDFERGANLLKRIFFDLLALNEIETLISWLRAIPDEIVRTHPWLCVLDAWLLVLTGQAETIEARLQDAEVALHAAKGLPKTEADRIRAYVFAVRAQVLFIRGDAMTASRYAREVLSKLAPQDSVIAATTASILGAAQSYGGDFTSAVSSFEKAKAISLASGNQFNAMVASSALAQIAAIRGYLHNAHQICRDGLRQMETSASLAPGYALVGLADILREWNDLEPALDYAAQGVEMCELLGQADILMTAYGVLARVRRAMGDFDSALTTLEKARRVASEISVWSLDAILQQQARLYLAKGELEPAVRWAQESGYSVNEPLFFHRETGLFTLARVLMAQGEHTQAEALLERLDAFVSGSDRGTSIIEVCLLRSLNCMAQGDEHRAGEMLERALALSEPENYTRIYLDEGEAALALVRKLAPDSKLLQRIIVASSAGNQELIEPLSERELDVLRLLAKGHSNPQIAEQLYISLNTVKAHVKNIFSKLEVNNRSQAILKAQELDLL